MRNYCDRVEQKDGQMHRKELDHMANWYEKQYSNFNKILVNYGKAVEYSRKSLYYLEKCNGQDSLIYHMYGDALRFQFKAECEEIQKSGADVSNEQFLDFEL